MMRQREVRIVVAAIAAEALGVLFLVIIVAIFGPHESGAAQAFAEQAGIWVGPISGFVLCVIGGYWVGSSNAGSPLLGGLALGIAAAALDVGIIFAAGAPFRMIFALSNIGRVVAGTTGGWLRSRANPDRVRGAA
jgi:hypothetical protein